MFNLHYLVEYVLYVELGGWAFGIDGKLIVMYENIYKHFIFPKCMNVQNFPANPSMMIKKLLQNVAHNWWEASLPRISGFRAKQIRNRVEPKIITQTPVGIGTCA